MKQINELIDEQVRRSRWIKDAIIDQYGVDMHVEREREQLFELTKFILGEVNDLEISFMIDEGKQKRMDSYKPSESLQKGSGTSSGGEESPSAKQISYATQLGIEVEGKGYTKKTLSEAIDKKLKKVPSKDIGK
jgi:hypothetical protein